MKDNILLTGGAGYIGSHITYELCELGFNVIVYDDLSSGYEDNIDSRATFIKGSIFDFQLLSDSLANIDSVIHLAALKDAGESMSKPELYSHQNIEGSLNVIKACIKKNVKKIVFSSSAAVYGIPKYLPIDESHDTNPINYYGYTKLCVEENLIWFNKIYGIKIACLRYFNAVGYNANGIIKKVEKNPSNLLPLVMEVLIGRREILEIYGKDYETYDGTCLRDYIHVKDLALAHLKTMEYLEYNSSPLIVNLATGQSSSVLDVLKVAKEVSGKRIPYKFIDRRSGDSPELYSISNFAKKKLGWNPEYSDLKFILESMWSIYKRL